MLNSLIRSLIFTFILVFLLASKNGFTQIPPPTNVQARIFEQDLEVTSIRITWTYSNPDIYKFLIYAKTSRADTFQIIGETEGWNFEYIDRVPTQNETYYYKISALDKEGKESPLSQESNPVIVTIPQQSGAQSPPSSPPPQSFSPTQPPSPKTLQDKATATVPTTSQNIQPSSAAGQQYKEQQYKKVITIKNFFWKINTKSNQIGHIQEFLSSQKLLFKYKKNIYDLNTVNAIMKFQRRNGLKSTGTIGPLTLKRIALEMEKQGIKLELPSIKLNRRLKLKDRGEDVFLLNILLRELGYSNKPPLYTYTYNTYIAVKKFQKANKLKITGIVDDATLNKINQFLNK